eukprot:Polyplicarium_translucidae@DN3088_c0_g1_i2.p1
MNDVMHFVVPVVKKDSTWALIYARSHDYGETWVRSDGSPLALPMRFTTVPFKEGDDPDIVRHGRGGWAPAVFSDACGPIVKDGNDAPLFRPNGDLTWTEYEWPLSWEVRDVQPALDALGISHWEVKGRAVGATWTFGTWDEDSLHKCYSNTDFNRHIDLRAMWETGNTFLFGSGNLVKVNYTRPGIDYVFPSTTTPRPEWTKTVPPTTTAAPTTRVTLNCANPQRNAPYPMWDMQEEWDRSDQIWWAKDFADHRHITHSNLFTHVTFAGDNFFVVYRDVDQRIRVVHVVESTGYEAEYYLDPNPDYIMWSWDARQGASIGMDEKGYIHVTATSIFHPFHTKWNQDFPERYMGAKCMAWRSDGPMDISSFSFRGHEAKHCPHGDGVVYPRYLRDSHGRLYWMASIAHKINKVNQYPHSGIGISRYIADTEEWEAIGGPSPSDPSVTILSMDVGSGDAGAGQAYGKAFFDPHDVLHVSMDVLYSPDEYVGNSATHFIYARSCDYGRTWYRHDGSPVEAPFQVTGPDSHLADIVVSNAKGMNRYSNVVALRDGQPLILMQDTGQFMPDGNGAWKEVHVEGITAHSYNADLVVDLLGAISAAGWTGVTRTFGPVEVDGVDMTQSHHRLYDYHQMNGMNPEYTRETGHVLCLAQRALNRDYFEWHVNLTLYRTNYMLPDYAPRYPAVPVWTSTIAPPNPPTRIPTTTTTRGPTWTASLTSTNKQRPAIDCAAAKLTYPELPFYSLEDEVVTTEVVGRAFNSGIWTRGLVGTREHSSASFGEDIFFSYEAVMGEVGHPDVRYCAKILHINGNVHEEALIDGTTDLHLGDKPAMWRTTIGIDERGRLHATGAMDEWPKRAPHAMPREKRGAHVMYWRTSVPLDINTFEFLGHDPANAPPQLGWYGMRSGHWAFINDKQGRLYAYVVTTDGDQLNGYAFGRFNTATDKWEFLGAEPVEAQAELLVYSNVKASLRLHCNFDRMDILQCVMKIAGMPYYARSCDYGETFHDSEGRPIDLPMNLHQASHKPEPAGPAVKDDIMATILEDGSPMILDQDNKFTAKNYDNGNWEAAIPGFERANTATVMNAFVDKRGVSVIHGKRTWLVRDYNATGEIQKVDMGRWCDERYYKDVGNLVCVIPNAYMNFPEVIKHTIERPGGYPAKWT